MYENCVFHQEKSGIYRNISYFDHPVDFDCNKNKVT